MTGRRALQPKCDAHYHFVKMLVTLELHDKFGSNCILIFIIVQPQVCKAVKRLLGEFKT